MPDIKGRLNEIDKEIRTLESKAKAAKNEVRDLGYALQFDPTNVATVREKFAQMRTQLDLNVQTMEKYKQRLADIRNAQKSTYDIDGLRKLNKEAEDTSYVTNRPNARKNGSCAGGASRFEQTHVGI